MIGVFCLWWIGVKLAAPGWYFGLLVFAGILSLIKFAVDMFKAGKKLLNNSRK